MVLQMLASEESIAGLSQHSMTIDGQKITYLDNGLTTAPRTVVLVHGFGDSSATWNFFARIFRDGGFRIIAPDLLGFGDSARPADGDYSYKAQAQRVLTLMKNLNVAQAHLVGNSMGGVAAAVSGQPDPDGCRWRALQDHGAGPGHALRQQPAGRAQAGGL